MMTYYLITFESTHLAIRTERLLKERFAVTMIPTPRDLSASCGLSLMLETEAPQTAVADLIAQGLEGMRLFKVTRSENGTRHYEDIEWRFPDAPGHTVG